MSGFASIDHLKSDIPPTGNGFRARAGLNREATSDPSRKYCVFLPSIAANHTLKRRYNASATMYTRRYDVGHI